METPTSTQHPFSLNIQGVLKIALQWCSKCYSVGSVTKIIIPKGVQIIYRSRC
jgi:hypothetical protein